MSLNNDFRTSRRSYNEKGGFFGIYTGADALYPSAGAYSINTTSHILSAGINLLNIFALAGSTGSAFTVVNAGSANWNSTYSSVNTLSANWSSVYTSYNASSAGLVTSINSGSTQGVIEYSRLGGGGPYTANLANLSTTGSPTFSNINISNNATISGNLSVLGDLTFLNTTVSVTSALSVVNAGTGPALFVKQSGTEPIAYFRDSEGGDIIFSNTGYLGLNTGLTTPNERLTVAGNISASGIATLSGAVLKGIKQTSTPTGNRLVTVETDGTLTYDPIATDSVNVDGIGLVANRLTKSTSTTSTLTASKIIDNGSTIFFDRSVGFMMQSNDIGNTANSAVISRQVYSTYAASTGTTLSTFPIEITSQGGGTLTIIAARYNVMLYSLTPSDRRTTFDIIGSISPFSLSGTVYGIVDNQAISLLGDVDLTSSGAGSLMLTITSAGVSSPIPRAFVEGIGYYVSLNDAV